MTRPSVVILDNYDSFVFNLYQRIGELCGVAATVVRNDRISVDGVRALAPTHLVISPGPGNPEDPAAFGVCGAVIRELGPTVPLLGVCLGHQGIGAALGGRVIRAEPVHGKTSLVHHRGQGVLAGLPSPFRAMRYHSLVLDEAALPDGLEVTARTSDGTVMGVRHRRWPVEGVQFHPESIGTPQGIRLLANFLGVADAPRVDALVAEAERAAAGVEPAGTAPSG
jgi:anthranilate synthase/aminodeoxychorismate synthase-like glutamine amidotransferase